MANLAANSKIIRCIAEHAYNKNACDKKNDSKNGWKDIGINDSNNELFL